MSKSILKKISDRLRYYKEMWGLFTHKGIECNINHGDTVYKIIANSKIELYNRARGYTEEKVTIDWIDNFIKDGDTVYDVGANIGIYCLLIAKKYPGSKIVAFEPEAGNFYKLNKNIMLNRIKNILPFPIGLSDKTGLSRFYVSSTDLGSSCHALEKPFSDGIKFTPKREQGIAAYSLNDFVLSPDIPFPNHIKIDVDGFESNVIKGSGNVLKDERMKSIILEITQSVNDGSIEKFIKDSGFREEKRETWNYGNGDVSNILFVKVHV